MEREHQEGHGAHRVNALKRFFWFCSGADLSILEAPACVGDQNRYAGIGATVFVTALLAALSGGYALFTVFRSYAAALPLGLLWGVVVFNFDRNIIMGMSKGRGGLRGELLVAAPRFLAALIISLVITAPLEVKLFEESIADELVREGREAAGAEPADVARLTQEIKKYEEQNQSMRDELTLRGQEVDRLYREIAAEADGTGGSGEIGWGPRYEEKVRHYDEVNKALNGLRDNYEPLIRENAAKITAREDQRKLLIDRNRQTAERADTFLRKLGALHRLTRRDETMAFAFWLILALFIIIETSPVLLKLLSARGPYDTLKERREREVVLSEERLLADLPARVSAAAENGIKLREAVLDLEAKTYGELVARLDRRRDFAEAQEAVAAEIVGRLQRRMLENLREAMPTKRPAGTNGSAPAGREVDMLLRLTGEGG